MRLDPGNWFATAWPDRIRRFAVLSEYRGLATSSKHLLTDIAKRGGVFASFPPSNGDMFENGRREGRRELALEIIQLAGMGTTELVSLADAALRRLEHEESKR